MNRQAEPGLLTIDSFPAFELDGFSKRSGLSSLDFTVSIYFNGAESTLPTVISEIGSTGDYSISFTPPSPGFYEIQVLIDFNKEIWRESFDVVDGGPSTIRHIRDQVDKIDIAPTLGTAAATSGSLLDRLANKSAAKTYNQATDSLEGLRDRMG